MGRFFGGRVSCFAVVGFVVGLFMATHSYAGGRESNLGAELLQSVLEAAGVESEVIPLKRDDGFDEGLFFETPDGSAIILGFNKNGLEIGQPFMLLTMDSEAVAQISIDGALSIISGDTNIVATGLLDFIECTLNSALDMIEKIRVCEFDLICIIRSGLESVIAVAECLLDQFPDKPDVPDKSGKE